MNISYKNIFILLMSAGLLLLMTSCKDKKGDVLSHKEAPPESFSRKRILYVDSYSLEFQWIQGITRGILGTLNIVIDDDENLDSSDSLYDLKIYHMKSKQNSSTESLESAVREILALIEDWAPEVIIISDDNAAQYLVVPYLMESEIPIVFCGINWDASVYGFPTDHITGMIEINLIDKMVEELKKYSEGGRIGYIRDNATTSRKESENYEKLLDIQIRKKFPDSFREWREEFLELQEEVDIILVGYPNALKDWDGDMEPYKEFLRDNTHIPTGSWDQWTADWVLMSFALDPEEQGEFAAAAAVRILNGDSPGRIPVVRNQKARIFLNMGMAKKLGIIFPMDLIERSNLIENWHDG